MINDLRGLYTAAEGGIAELERIGFAFRHGIELYGGDATNAVIRRLLAVSESTLNRIIGIKRIVISNLDSARTFFPCIVDIHMQIQVIVFLGGNRPLLRQGNPTRERRKHKRHLHGAGPVGITYRNFGIPASGLYDNLLQRQHDVVTQRRLGKGNRSRNGLEGIQRVIVIHGYGAGTLGDFLIG